MFLCWTRCPRTASRTAAGGYFEAGRQTKNNGLSCARTRVDLLQQRLWASILYHLLEVIRRTM